MVRPNFNETVTISGQNLLVTGVSDEPEDISTLRVLLAQENRSDGGATSEFKPIVERRGLAEVAAGQWQVTIPLGSFKPGPAMAHGLELRKQNFTTISWTEPVKIVQ
jgi:hypothetical protein